MKQITSIFWHNILWTSCTLQVFFFFFLERCSLRFCSPLFFLKNPQGAIWLPELRQLCVTDNKQFYKLFLFIENKSFILSQTYASDSPFVGIPMPFLFQPFVSPDVNLLPAMSHWISKVKDTFNVMESIHPPMVNLYYNIPFSGHLVSDEDTQWWLQTCISLFWAKTCLL